MLFQDQCDTETSAGASSKGRESSDLHSVVFCCQSSYCSQLPLSPKILDQFRSGSISLGVFEHSKLASPQI